MMDQPEIIREERLPPGPGVLPSEIGEPGPWYGVRMSDGSDYYGWWRLRAAAEAWAEMKMKEAPCA